MKNGETTHTVQLKIRIPPDYYNLMLRVFYAAWSANTILGRVGANGVPALSSSNISCLSNSNWVQTANAVLGIVAEVGKYIGNALALAEGIIASVDLYRAIKRKKQASANFTEEKWKAAMEAKKEIDDFHLQRHESKDADTLRRQAESYLCYTRAQVEFDKARDGLVVVTLAWLRDCAAQGLRGGWDLGVAITKACLDPIASVVSFALSALVGVGQIVAGAAEFVQARAMARKVSQAQSDANIRYTAILNGTAPLLAKHKDRLKMGNRLQEAGSLAPAMFQAVQKMRASQLDWATTLMRWAKARIGYGTFSVSTAIVGAVLMSTGTGAVIATGGLALLLIGGTAGAIWLGFAVYKAIVKYRAGTGGLADRLEVEEAMSLRRPSAGERTKFFHTQNLGNWSLDDLNQLTKEFPRLEDNCYFKAAVFSKLLTSRLDSKQRVSMRDARLQVSAALQALGMEKIQTSMLKRASLETTLEILHDYLRGHVDHPADPLAPHQH